MGVDSGVVSRKGGTMVVEVVMIVVLGVMTG